MILKKKTLHPNVQIPPKCARFIREALHPVKYLCRTFQASLWMWICLNHKNIFYLSGKIQPCQTLMFSVPPLLCTINTSCKMFYCCSCSEDFSVVRGLGSVTLLFMLFHFRADWGQQERVFFFWTGSICKVESVRYLMSFIWQKVKLVSRIGCTVTFHDWLICLWLVNSFWTEF